MNLHENNLKKFLPPLLKMNYLTVTEFCIQLGIHRRVYYEYRSDKRRPSVATVLKMAEILRCSPKEILEQVRTRKRFYGSKKY